MEEEKEICPLLGNDCIKYNCAWFGVDTEETCAMYSIASSLGSINARTIDADEFLQVVERIAE